MLTHFFLNMSYTFQQHRIVLLTLFVLTILLVALLLPELVLAEDLGGGGVCAGC